MQPFVYDGLPCRVIFGSGTLAKLADEIDRLGAKRALLLSTPEQATAAKDLAASLGPRAAGVFARAAMHTPVEITELAMREVGASKADCMVALGGGSTIGLGKAIALRSVQFCSGRNVVDIPISEENAAAVWWAMSG